MRKIIILLLQFIVTIGCSNAQVSLNKYQTTFDKLQLQSDFNQLVNELETHPAVNEFISKSEWNNLIKRQREKIQDRMMITEFNKICAPIVTKIGCGHTNLYNLEYNADTKKYLVYLPYKVEIIGDEVFITKNLSYNNPIDLGAKIIKIDGINITDLTNFIISCVSADGYDMNYKKRMTSKGFTYYLHSLFGIKNEYQITYELNGKIYEKTIELNKLLPAQNETNGIADNPELIFDIDENSKTAIITIKSFSFYNNVVYFKSFIDDCLIKIQRKNLNYIIIDLRGNQGGDPYCSSYLLRAISNKPIAYYKNDKNYPELLKPQPSLGHNLKSKPYILIDGFGFSSTGHFGALVQQHKLGTFVGEEMGSTYSCNVAQKNVTLHNTKLFLQVAQKIVAVRVNAQNFDKRNGIVPDIPIKRTLATVLSNKDETLEYLLKQFTETKK